MSLPPPARPLPTRGSAHLPGLGALAAAAGGDRLRPARPARRARRSNVELDSLDLTAGSSSPPWSLAVGAVTLTGLLGEVFFSGAVAISLTHPAREEPPSLREIARRLNYGRLIAVDLLYVALVAVGLLLGFVPGHPRLRLARPRRAGGRDRGPHRAAAPCAAASSLVRGNFWLVFLVLVPIEIVGDAIGERPRRTSSTTCSATPSSPPGWPSPSPTSPSPRSSRSPRCCSRST